MSSDRTRTSNRLRGGGGGEGTPQTPVYKEANAAVRKLLNQEQWETPCYKQAKVSVQYTPPEKSSKPSQSSSQEGEKKKAAVLNPTRSIIENEALSRLRNAHNLLQLQDCRPGVSEVSKYMYHNSSKASLWELPNLL
jgi:hypothetical protein